MIDNKYFSKFNGNPGLELNKISEIKLPVNLPTDYFQLIQLHNGGEGFIGEEYIILYKIEELVKMNKIYEVEQFVPGIFLFGSNGGGEALAFDLRPNKVRYVLIPFIFEYDAIIELGDSVDQFLERIYSTGFFL